MWEEVVAPPRAQHDARDFRNALGCFPTGVCLVTALAPDGARAGMTANSFSSVSLDPPLVLFSLARRLQTLAALLSAEAFAIHFLREDQQHISARFAKPSSNKWEGVRRRAGVTAGFGVVPPP